MVVTFVLSAWFLPAFVLGSSGSHSLLVGDLPTAGRLWIFNLLAIAMELADLRKPGGRELAALNLRLMSLAAKLLYVACNAISVAIFFAWLIHS